MMQRKRTAAYLARLYAEKVTLANGDEPDVVDVFKAWLAGYNARKRDERAKR